MRCKVPVIASNISSIPEIAGDAAILIDPFNTNELKNSIINILEDSNLKENLSIKGLTQSKKFSWRNTAKLTLNAYKEIYEKFS